MSSRITNQQVIFAQKALLQQPQSRLKQTNKNPFLFSLSRPSSNNQTIPISPIPVP
ncbi:hypothetical protein Tsubulata_030186, partial [Turnera subulata]